MTWPKEKKHEPKFFSVIAKDSETLARSGLLRLKDQEISTPVFMPVGTLANVKAVWGSELSEMGYSLILGNSYHLSLQPGAELIAKQGGLKKFMSWPHAILTDSGGYQVFSLAKRVRFHPKGDGVEFQSHIDGSSHFFSPQSVIELQSSFASDLVMVLDDCPSASAPLERVHKSLERTHRWAKESLKYFEEERKMKAKAVKKKQRIFGIVQGALQKELRQKSLDFIQNLPFDGIALGGLSVGEERSELYQMLSFLGPRLDQERPRYLMGVGAIVDILEAVKNGVDMFDCVLPTRNARNAQAFTSQGLLRLRNREHKAMDKALDPLCHCKVCTRYSRSYIHHLFAAKEMLGPMMLTYHNLFFYSQFMDQMRAAIQENSFLPFYTHWRNIYL